MRRRRWTCPAPTQIDRPRATSINRTKRGACTVAYRPRFCAASVPADESSAQFYHIPGGANTLYMDGHVRAVGGQVCRFAGEITNGDVSYVHTSFVLDKVEDDDPAIDARPAATSVAGVPFRVWPARLTPALIRGRADTLSGKSYIPILSARV